jgi:rubrerythrin
MEIMKDLEELAEGISIAIAREKASVEYYSKAYQKARTESARRVFALLIEQEKMHEEKLRGQLQEVKSQLEMERLKAKKKRSSHFPQE